MVSKKVSVIIPVRDRPALLAEAVSSVLAQTYRPLEILIVDDGSTDTTLDVARRLEEEHPGVVLVLQGPGVGPGPAREVGRVHATGAFIQYLDSDDRLMPDKFALQIAALEAQPEADIAYGITRLTNAEGRVLKEPFKWTGKKIEYLFPGLLVDRWWCTHTPLYRRSLCDRIGPWSDLRYSQDWEYDARAGAFGAKLVHVDSVVSEHRAHGGVRQTGGGRWLTAEDQLRFFSSLYTQARNAGVQANSPEMKHFSRWVFSAARAAGAVGFPGSASTLLSIAQVANGKFSAELSLCRIGASLIGWRALCVILEKLRHLPLLRAPSASLRQSWMTTDNKKSG